MRWAHRKWARDAYKWEEGHWTWGEMLGVFISLWVTAITAMRWLAGGMFEGESVAELSLLFGVLLLSCIHRQLIFARVQRRAHLHRMLSAMKRGQDNGQMAA